MHPGMVLGGRYRLDDLLEDLDGARFWRATDTVLRREVAVHAVGSQDQRAERLLACARVSATINEPHVLKVLDCDITEEVTWVVHEWGQGASLDIIVAEAPLSPDRAAWLVREAAGALAPVHAQGHAHGLLNPENVLVTEAGTVKLIGFATAAAMHQAPDGSVEEAMQRDVRDLGGLLYCALTGRWPGPSESAVPPAPREGRALIRPRRVRAGVPRQLDGICERIIGRSSEWSLTTAHDVAAALGTYIGAEPVAEPVVLHDEQPTDPDPTIADLGAPRPVSRPPAPPLAGAAPDDTDTDTAASPEPVEAGPGTRGQVPLTDTADALDTADTADAVDTGADARAADPDATQAAPALSGRPVPPGPAAPPFEPVAERPLFAPEGTRRTPKPGAVTAPPPDLSDDSGSAPPPDDPTPSGWPFRDEEPAPAEWPEDRGRGWLRLPVLLGVVVLLVTVVVVAALLARNPNLPFSPGDDDDPAPAAASRRIPIDRVTDLDPAGDPPEENPDEARFAADGDPDTAWRTLEYRGRPDLGGLKDGVGLVVDLGDIARVSRVRVRLVGRPTDLTLFAVPTTAGRPDSVDGLDRLARRTNAGPQVDIRLKQPTRTRYLVVWLTSLPPAEGGFRGQVAEISVRS